MELKSNNVVVLNNGHVGIIVEFNNKILEKPKNKDECNVTEYSIQQTSLEQIFNQFAALQISFDFCREIYNLNTYVVLQLCNICQISEYIYTFAVQYFILYSWQR